MCLGFLDNILVCCISLGTVIDALDLRISTSVSSLVKFVIPWAEVTRLERVSTVLMHEAVRVGTRQRQREFSMFLNLEEAYGVIGQLADIALRRLLDSEGLELDRTLQQPTCITKRSERGEGISTQLSLFVMRARGFKRKCFCPLYYQHIHDPIP